MTIVVVAVAICCGWLWKRNHELVLELADENLRLQRELDRTRDGLQADLGRVRTGLTAKLRALQEQLAPYQEAEGFALPAQDEASRLISCPVCGRPSVHFPGDFCTLHQDPDVGGSTVSSSVSVVTSTHTPSSQQQHRAPLHRNKNEEEAHALVTANGPTSMEDEDPPVECGQPSNVIITKEELLAPFGLAPAVRRRAARAIKQCGFLYLDEMFSDSVIDRFKDAYDAFKASENQREARTGAVGPWRYPVQGVGRREYFLPFRHPFNSTQIYGDGRLRTILAGLLFILGINSIFSWRRHVRVWLWKFLFLFLFLFCILCGSVVVLMAYFRNAGN